MRILHILDHSLPLHSGYVFRTLGILRAQRDRGWETFHLTTPKHPVSGDLEEMVEGWTFYRTPAPRDGVGTLPVVRELIQMKATARRLEEVIGHVRPDILHAHSPVLNAFPAMQVGRRHGIPVVYEVRAFWEDAAVDHGTSTAGGPRYRATRYLETVALRRADAVTTICEGLRTDILDRGVPPEKVTVIPNAVDVEAFSAGNDPGSALIRQLGLENATVLGFIGSFYAYEGLDLLLEALPRVMASLPLVKVLLVGGGREEEKLKALSRELGIDDHVIFTGRVPQDQVMGYYDLVDLLVYPRRSMRLTEIVTPLKPLEAMAQGRILLASNVGGHRELIDDGKTGYLFEADRVEDLARRVVDVLQRKTEWPGIRAAGRKFVEEERNWRASVARYEAVYGGILEGSGQWVDSGQ